MNARRSISIEVLSLSRSHKTTWSIRSSTGPALMRWSRWATTSQRAWKNCWASFAQEGHLDPAVDVDAFKEKADKAYRQRTKEYIWEQHATPLRRVVGMLPVDELALLAETSC